MTEENLNKEENVGQQETQQTEAPQTEKQSEQKTEKEPGGINAIAILSYLGLLVLVPLLVAKGDEFVQFHAKQGLTLLIAAIIGTFVGVVPIIGWILSPFIMLFFFVLAIMGIINVLKKERKELPVIGKYAKNFKI